MPNPHLKIPAARLPRVVPSGSDVSSPRSIQGEEERERISEATRAHVWKKRFGFRKTGTCVCCHQRTIYRDDFLCGFRRAYAGGGSSDVSNLEPICSRCKKGMGTQDLVSWCKKLHEGFKTVKPMPKKTTAKKTVGKTTAKKSAAKPAAVKKTARKTTAKKPVRKTVAKKPAAKKAKK
ncbi:MAG: hypothetical protein LUO97_07010 [Methanomicrobiales archaeon]|nr:hypothetical protein [Methanomicrobiales archaeon]